MKKYFQKKAPNDFERNSGLQKSLKVKDLIYLGIAAIVGAGIFSTVGSAAFQSGPAVVLLFILTAIACGFSALCYAQFASIAPVSGSAYSYAYIAFGEIIAWIIGWDLIVEYAIGNITVAISWSDYLSSFLQGFNIDIPAYLETNYFSAKEAFELQTPSKEVAESEWFISNTEAYKSAPTLLGIPFIIDLPALFIVGVISILIYIGIKESKKAANMMVILKLFIILIVITIGLFYINPENWTPFAPHGISGIFAGTGAVFFAFIGFDALSTTAEECENPKRDLPKAMILVLIICTIIYILVSIVLTGMVSYTQLNVGDPLAHIFAEYDLHFLSGIVAFGALIAITSVLLVFQLGQPRIWYAMSQDGLLPKLFSRIHPKFKTPSFATIIAGLLVGIPILFTDLETVTDLTSFGTIFAFLIVCSGILFLDKEHLSTGFKVPYINGKYIFSSIVLLTYGSVFIFTEEFDISTLPQRIFLVLTLLLSLMTFIKSWSLIPVLGIWSNLFLLFQMNGESWIRFVIWMAIGLVIYFLMKIKNNNTTQTTA